MNLLVVKVIVKNMDMEEKDYIPQIKSSTKTSGINTLDKRGYSNSAAQLFLY